MFNPRRHLFGLVALLLALMVQLAAGAAMPRIDRVGIEALLCHAVDDSDGTAPQAPSPHAPPHCPLCPLCDVVHARLVAVLPVSPVMVQPRDGIIFRAELPPPALAPPPRPRSPTQPRAPPILL